MPAWSGDEIFAGFAELSDNRGPQQEGRRNRMTEVARRQILEVAFAGRSWTICVIATADARGADYYHADVFLGEAFIRRIVLDTAFENKIAAEVALTVAARKWVSEYEGVVHSGSTDFGELHS
jgi:hypothetical protein